MVQQKQPKVILFDIGGVCVRSPFQTILDYELSLGIPPGWVNYSLSRTSPNGFWHRLERGEIPLDSGFFAGFTRDLHDQTRWGAFYQRERAKHPGLLPADTPPLPAIDGEFLFNEMMSASSAPDPWMLPALQTLKTSGRYIIAALSNTVAFPPGHKLHVADFSADPLRRLFDVFVSSAHVGIRKPDPRMYEHALQRVDAFARANATSVSREGLGWEDGVRPGDVLFLDDIGENLKEARKQGFGTIKVPLGRAYEAVEQLEKVTGLGLAGSHPQVSEQPQTKVSKSRL